MGILAKILARVMAAAVLGLLAGPVAAQPEDGGAWPPTEPLPCLETGMHTAIINRISVDARERFFVTASDDKTVRVWDLRSGDLLRVLRVPSGLVPDEGKLYCAAISPDGVLVAAAGFSGKRGSENFQISICDRESGRLVRTLGGLPEVILHVAWSRDGRFLAATLGGGQGLRVFRSGDWSQVAQDTDYGDSSYWADFDSRGRLVTTCWDGFLRLYDSEFKLIRKERAPGGRELFSARFSPDGSLVAVGFNDSTQVNILSGADLTFRYAPDTRGVDNGDLTKVAWSRDGRRLYAGGRFIDKTKNYAKPILQWRRNKQGPATQVEVAATDTIMDLWPLGDGRMAYGAADPAFGIFYPDGRRGPVRLPEIIDFRGREKDLLLSQDGMVVQFRYDIRGKNLTWESHQTRLDLVQRRLTQDPAETEGLRPPEMAGATKGDWKNTREPRWQGRALKLRPYELSRSLAVAPDGQRLVLGADWYLYCFKGDGGQEWRASVPSTVWAVNVSGDGRFAVATLGDGTIRWYSMTDGRELLAFFLHRDGRWVMWCPEGFFDASPGGEKLMGYHLNQGAEGTPEFISMDRVYDLFYRKDLVAWRLEGRPEAEIKAALSRFGDIHRVLGRGLPPVVALVNQTKIIKQRERDFTVEVDLKDRGGGIGKVVYKLDGVTQETILARPVDLPGQLGRRRFSRPVTGKPGANKVEVIVYNKDNTVASEPVSFTVVVEQPQSKPALYGLAVGITKYRDDSLELKYAASDARDLAAELQSRAGGLFQPVQVQPLLNEQATTTGIEQAFADLAKVIRPEDVFVLYLAGHGIVLEDGRYYFVPQEVDYVNSEALKKKSLNQDKLTALLETIKARKSLVILDTCYAGAFASLPSRRGLEEKTALDRLMRATGRNFLAASAKQQFALEGYQGHGAFTHVLLEGLRGRLEGQRKRPDRTIYISDLAEFIEEEVPRITYERWKYRQVPMKNLQGSDFPIAVMK